MPSASPQTTDPYQGQRQPVLIRRARGRAEMLKFRHWHELAGNTGARAAARHLAALNDAGLLSAALNGGPLPAEHSALGRGGVAALAAARTMALVAVADGRIIGGLIAAPPIPLALQVAEQGPHAVVHVALNTIMIRAIAVVSQHRGYGVGRALLREAVATARRARVPIIFGQFDAATVGLDEFYRRCGMIVTKPGAALAFSDYLAAPVRHVPAAGHALFYLPLGTADRVRESSRPTR
ncbi:GNAT family N-acetyltransferase [Nocardia pseudovaccinii]|uniref:GNAT family N-acetyltransferase n=1 Tax=Nocardia pseudovaccinii TaxID=189540 RepID=UPI000A7ECE87|nr:GNAT family N-acetyltransferase [Nocardia pseudovaccinii]